MLKLLIFNKKPNNEHGFTLLELVLVVVAIGIFSVIAAPKFNNPISYTAQSRAETFASDLRHIKNLAAANDRCVAITTTVSGGITTIIGSKPSDSIYPPCNGNTVIFSSALDSNTSITGPVSPFYFNNVGQPNMAATYTVLAGGVKNYVGVNSFTGLVVVCTSLPCP
jgi:prepilin-type N-terminal cleavage/methylation domain-containing protein